MKNDAIDVFDVFERNRGMTTSQDWHQVAFESFLKGYAKAHQSDYADSLYNRLAKEGLEYMMNDSYLKKMGMSEGHHYLNSVCRALANKYGTERR